MESSVFDSSFASVVEFYTATKSRLLVKRDGHSVLRSAGVPKPIVLIDTREQRPLPLFENHPNWVAGERKTALRSGDYSIEGMQGLLALERKSLPDLIQNTVAVRKQFLAQCARLAKFRWKAIMVEASYEDIKRGWDSEEIPSEVHPNAVCGLLDAVEAKFGIPVVLTSRFRELATERAASWLSKHFTYWWLEQRGYGRVLIDSDGL